MLGFMDLSVNPALTDTDAALLAHILNGAWGTLFHATPAIVRARMSSGQLFVVAHDQATPEEAAYVRDTYHHELPDNRIPIALLETIDTRTGGDPARVPHPYELLTCGGVWRAPLSNADTLVFVDLTTATSRQGSGAGSAVLRHALAHRQHRHVFTFTPDVEATRNWHLKHGARATGVRFANARPGHPTPDVQLMDYSSA